MALAKRRISHLLKDAGTTVHDQGGFGYERRHLGTLMEWNAANNPSGNVLQRPKFKVFLARRGLDFKDASAQVVSLSRLVVPKPLTFPVVIQDPSDDKVLVCTVTAGVDMIITGDEHLLEQKVFRGISILSPAIFLQRFGK
jgi:hypothetical protein